MSRDRGVAAQAVDYGYGLVVDRAGEPISDFIVSGANQEHGIITSRTNENRADSATLPLGALIRVLPNHACATASQYDRYYVVSGETVVAEWPRINGW